MIQKKRKGATLPSEGNEKGSSEKAARESGSEKKAAQIRKPKVQSLTPNAVIKKVKFGQMGISCCIDSFGEEAGECFMEGGVIYINRDHPLYRREEKRAPTMTLHITRLLAQEIALMVNPSSPREAFEKQSQILKDALEED